MFSARSGIPIGRLFGIRIMLDWSLLFIFLLLLFSLGSGVFPMWHPEWSPALSWGVAFGAAVLFFVSILVHELSHSLVAKAYGIPVRSITLFLFGGIANIEEDPDSPKKEALMAAIGPVTSIALGVGFSVLAALLARAEGTVSSDPVVAIQNMSPLATLLAWLGPVNIIVGVFNMLPGFPLDGGRVLRAALWGITGDLNKATRWASRVGQGFAALLILAGIAMAFGVRLPVLGTGLISGLWLVFIGWFLNTAAVMSYRQLVIKQALQGVTVSRLMRRHLPPSIETSSTLDALVDEYVMRSGASVFPVVDQDYTVGMVFAEDVRKVNRQNWHSTRVGDIAKRFHAMPTLKPEQSAQDALGVLAQGTFSDLPVVDQNQLVGLIGQQDISRWLDLYTKEGGLTRLEPSGSGRSA
jgi:Zn-dependent protease